MVQLNPNWWVALLECQTILMLNTVHFATLIQHVSMVLDLSKKSQRGGKRGCNALFLRLIQQKLGCVRWCQQKRVSTQT